MVWVDCPKCSAKDTCKYYEQMKEELLKQTDRVCIKGCK